jgi:hypothetical protein
VKEIAKALLSVQKALDPVHKGKSGYGYKYADLPAVMNACIDTLNNAGIVVAQVPVQTEKQAAAIHTRLIHADSGEEISGIIEVPYAEQAKMSAAQCYGSAMTYARRYALVSMIGIVTDDDDGASAGRKDTKADRPPAKAPVKSDAEKADAAVAFASGCVDVFRNIIEPQDKNDYISVNWPKISACMKYPEAAKLLIDAGLVEEGE